MIETSRHGTFTQAADGSWAIALTLTLERPYYRLLEIRDGDRMAITWDNGWHWGRFHKTERGWEWWGDHGYEIEVYSGLEVLIPEEVVLERVPGARG